MDEAEKVLERLRRIRELDEDRAAPSLLLDELRELVVEAERWARVEGDARARAAVLSLSDSLGAGDPPEPEKVERDEVERNDVERNEAEPGDGVRLGRVRVH